MPESSSPPQHPGAEAKAKYLGIPGVRFVPSDEELIVDYLEAKLRGEKQPTNLVHEADVYREHPKELTRRLGRGVEGFWYVFSERQRKYPKGTRPSRSTGTDGRWKPVGQNGPVLGADKEILGHKCALAYEAFVHDDDQSRGWKSSRRRLEKTEWKMCEFVAKDTDKPISSTPTKMLLNEWVLCRITRKAGADQMEVEDNGQATLVDEAYEDEELQNTPPDPSQQAQVQDLVDDGADGSDGTDADVEPPCDGDRLKEVQFVDYYHHPEVWGTENECGEDFYQEQWNVHGTQFGATADPDPMANQLGVPADPDSTMSLLEVVPTDPQPWDIASFLFDDFMKAMDDAEKGNTAAAAAAAANKTSAPATASVK